MRKLLLLLLIFTTSIFGVQSQNLLVNGDCESWVSSTEINGWTKAENIVQESTIVHGGSYSIKQSVTSTSDISQTIDVTPGVSYTIAIWYYVESGDDTDARIWSNFKDGSGGNLTDFSDDLKGPNGAYFTSAASWQKYEVTVTAPSTAASLYFEVRAYSGSTVYWDDFSVTGSGVSNAALINAFEVPNQVGSSVIDNDNSTVTFNMVEGTDVTALVPVITVSTGATISPASGTAQDFSSPVAYEVTAEDGTTKKTWNASVNFVVDKEILLNEDFETVTSDSDIDLTNWSIFAEVGTRNWIGKSFSGNKYAQASSYGSSDDENISWLITPDINLDNTAQENFSFDIAVGYWRHSGFSVLISSDFNGSDLAAATWTDITSNFTIPVEPASGYGSFASAGVMALDNYTGTVNIAFKYAGKVGAGETTTYQIDNVIVEEKIELPSDGADILTFVLAEEISTAIIDVNLAQVTSTVAWDTDVTALVPSITVSEGATIAPDSGVVQDFTLPIMYKVTSKDGVIKDWKVTVAKEDAPANKSIYEIQFTEEANGESPLFGEEVFTKGIVTGFDKYGFYIQDSAAAWNGIYVYPGSFKDSVAVGDSIIVGGKVNEYWGLTQLFDVFSVEVLNSGNALPTAISVTVPEIDEAYESVIVTTSNLTCVDTDLYYDAWRVSSGTDSLYVGTEIFNYSPALGDVFNSISGIVTFKRDYFRILPRSLDDLDKVLSTETNILEFVLAEQKGTAVINEVDHTVKIEVVEGTDLSSLTPTISVSSGATIDPNTGVAQDFSSDVTYTVTAEDGETSQAWIVSVTVYVGVNDVELNNVDIYPNPFANSLTISNLENVSSVMVNNVIGQNVMKVNVTGNEVVLNTESLQKGIYLITIVDNNNNMRTEKMIKE